LALTRNLVTSLVKYERIETTLPKAKEMRSPAEKLISMAKKGTLHAQRNAFKMIRDKTILKKLFDTIGPRYAERNGGYTRIYKLGNRLGDCAPMAILELVDRDLAAAPKRKEKKKEEGEKKG
jgi:large subunit ribosomal protein L17